MTGPLLFLRDLPVRHDSKYGGNYEGTGHI
jgi:hypothetical protein